MRQRRRHPRSRPVLIHLRVILLPPGNRLGLLDSRKVRGTLDKVIWFPIGAVEIGEQPKANQACPPHEAGGGRAQPGSSRVSHMPCHRSLTCVGEWPAMSMALSHSKSALHCKRRARSISALRRAASLLSPFLVSGAGADGTGVGGGTACCLGGGTGRVDRSGAGVGPAAGCSDGGVQR